MAELTVTRTKEYLILKIPLKAVRRGKVPISSRTERAITKGLEDYARGRGAGPFTAKQAVAFLSKI